VKLTRLVFLLVLTVVGSFHLGAVPITLDFGTGLSGAGGTLTYTAGGVLSGTNIRIGALTVGGAPVNNGVYLVYGSLPSAGSAFIPGLTSGVLTFTSGSLLSIDSSGVYHFGGGGTISIVGYLPGITGSSGSPVTLLSGNFVGATYNPATGGAALYVSSGTDIKDPTLLAYFGIPTGTPFLFSGTVHTNTPTYSSGGSFTAGAQASTNILNTAVPEPGSMMLLGTALIGVAGLARRRFLS